jgi:single-stranded DNA-binding protein
MALGTANSMAATNTGEMDSRKLLAAPTGSIGKSERSSDSKTGAHDVRVSYHEVVSFQKAAEKYSMMSCGLMTARKDWLAC